MLKKVLIIIFVLVTGSYLILAMTHFNLYPSNLKCNKIEIIIKDSSDIDLFTKCCVAGILRDHHIQLVGAPMNKINTRLLESTIRRYPLVQSVECYKTLGGKVLIQIVQRIPVLHVMNGDGANYFLDRAGHVLPAKGMAIYRPVVTGKVDKVFATKILYKIGNYIYDNVFWRSLIEQINLLPSWNIELVPRIGNHIVYLGHADNYGTKLNRLKIFYEKGLNRIGWNKYSRISLEFGNQIICTKREVLEVKNDSIK